MKFERNNRYFTVAVYAFGVIAAAMVFFFSLRYPEKIQGGLRHSIAVLAPVIWGFVIAFCLNPLMCFLEKKALYRVFNKPQQKQLHRVIALVLTYVIFLGALTLFCIMVVPSLISSITDLINNIQGYYNSGMKMATELLTRYHISTEVLEPFKDIGNKLVGLAVKVMQSMLPQLYGVTLSVTSALTNVFIGLVFSIYMLASKDLFVRQFKRVLYAFVRPRPRARILRVATLANDTFGNYIFGHVIDSLIIGAICYIVMLIFGWPYPELVSVIVGVTNMIPFFGPIIGGAPSVLLILLVNPWQALFFAIFIIILQQIDGNFIGPRIIGPRVGLSAFWVMFSVVVGGSLFGFVGMLIGVPIFAVFYTLMRSYLDRRIRERRAAEGENQPTEDGAERPKEAEDASL